jgi:deoxyribodipyrimidine photo-lyase
VTKTSLLWLRRDLRLDQHPALLEAATRGSVLPVFVRDPSFDSAPRRRADRLEAALDEFSRAVGGALCVRSGDPSAVLSALAEEVGATTLHISEEFTPSGRRRDGRVTEALRREGVEVTATGSPYAVPPGSVRTGGGETYRVFTPFSRVWREALSLEAVDAPDVEWLHGIEGEALDLRAAERGRAFGPVGERGAKERWREFLAGGQLRTYDELRDRPDLNGTSRMSVHLKFGEIHPLTMLRDIAAHPDAGSTGAERFITELAWRDFYADVLLARPDSAWRDWRPEMQAMPYDDVDPALLDAWREGRTGYPFVDAGMRQLLAGGWMHNRLRMITASFLVKDLHAWWPVGARHFLEQLLDADIASNNHGWQWVAGTGTDAAPYFRIFNPVTQGRRFDPQGDFVRRWIPELAHVPGPAVHEPWNLPAGTAPDYPERIVDHAAERVKALRRLEVSRGVDAPA